MILPTTCCYYSFSIVPVFLWCLSASTIVSLGLFFVISALNFILAIGTKYVG